MTAASDHVGVAIATRDRPDSLERCLRSLANGELLPAEVVVSDQSAGRETREVVAEASAWHLRLRYVPAPPGGLAHAQNAAFSAIESPVVAVLDDDCEADPRWLQVVDEAFRRDRGLVLLGGRVLPAEPRGERSEAVSSRTSARRRQLTGKSSPWLVGSGNNFAVRRECFERVGGGDERLGPGTAGQGALDMDLFYRLLRAGGRGVYEPDAVVIHDRATAEGRRSRRGSYGHGIGAMCVYLVRARDAYALRLGIAWLALRLRLLGGALVKGRHEALREEALVLGGTLRGLVHGMRHGG